MTTPDFATVGEAIQHWAAVSPDAPAALAPGRPPLSYGDLQRITGQVTAAAMAAGATPGCRIVLMIPQSRDAEVVNTAVSTFATPAPLNPALPPAALAALAGRLCPTLVIATATNAAAAEALGCPVLLLDPALLLPGAAPARDPEPRAPDDHAIILSTSGSTGEPRLIPRTHGNLAASTREWILHLGFTRDNLGLIASPPFHAMGASMFRHVLTGSAALIVDTTDPVSVVPVIRDMRPTWVLGVPSWFAGIAALETAPLPPMRMVMSGSAPMPSNVAAAISQMFAAPLIFDYGLTEAPCLALSLPEDDPAAPPRLLPLIPGTVIAADPDGAPLPAGREGEILANGPIIFPGSVGAETPEFLPGGWYRTGDTGVFDEDGRFRLTGRIKHLLNRGGEMIAPLEIERALQSHPAVADAAVIGVPHPTLGEDIEAIVVLRPGADASVRELRRWLLSHLVPSRVPRAIAFRDSLPLTPSGKLDRRALQAEVVARMADSGD